jgi:cobalt-zinc-cadmium efflux system membrane fusion protein
MKRVKRCLAVIAGLCLMLAGPIFAEEGHEEATIHLSPAEIDEFGIQLSPVGAGVIGRPIELAGEIVVNPDRFAHVVPRVDGIVRQVVTGLGDRVEAGAVMATIDSRELADLKSTFLATLERRQLARLSFEREERLWRQAISSERDYLQAKQAYAEAAIEARSARHKLQAIGFTVAHLQALPEEEDALFARFEIRAPFAGVVVAKHISLGESVAGDTEIYSVTDLRQVWSVLTVYQRDLKWIKEGMVVTIRDRESGDNNAQGTISYVSPVLDPETRTASVRVVIGNQDGAWRPGIFIRGTVSVEKVTVPLVVQRSAVQRMADREVVFVYDGTEFKLRKVVTGRAAGDVIEIISGVKAGEIVASKGAFTLKTQIEKGEFASGHNH